MCLQVCSLMFKAACGADTVNIVVFLPQASLIGYVSYSSKDITNNEQIVNYCRHEKVALVLINCIFCLLLDTKYLWNPIL